MRRRSFILGVPALLAAPAIAAGITPFFGEMLITGFSGLTPDDPGVRKVGGMLNRGEAAGVIIMGENVASPEQLRALTDFFRESSPLTPIISIDQEGGKVARLGEKNGFADWSSAADIAVSSSPAEARAYYEERAAEMARAGVNLNYGPVMDLNINPENPVIGDLGRAYGASGDDVLDFGQAFCDAHRAAGVLTCIKHFPGHGSSRGDSHNGVEDVTGVWEGSELAAFYNASRRGLGDTMMNAHLVHPFLSDGPDVPTSLSRKAVFEIRTKIGFTGPIITDDMGMGAVTDAFGPEEAAVRAVTAGNSLLIYSGYGEEGKSGAERALAALREAFSEGLIPAGVAEREIDRVRQFRLALS